MVLKIPQKYRVCISVILAGAMIYILFDTLSQYIFAILIFFAGVLHGHYLDKYIKKRKQVKEPPKEEQEEINLEPIGPITGEQNGN
mgnify:CR=1 FL=1